MAVSANPTLSQVIAEFGGPNNLTAYVRGGAYVPDTPANAAIATTASALKLSQFANAVKTTLPPAPYLADVTGSDHLITQYGSVTMTVYLTSAGLMRGSYSSDGSNVTYYTWLPSGRTASEYQYRYRIWDPNTSTWGGWSSWAAIPSNLTIASATATSDPNYYESGYQQVQLELGASGTTLSSCIVTAEAS